MGLIERALRATTAATLCVPTVAKVLSVFEWPLRVTTVDDRCRPLFFDMFSTISNFSIFPKRAAEPRASEKPFGGIRVPGAFLGASWLLNSPISDGFFDGF